MGIFDFSVCAMYGHNYLPEIIGKPAIQIAPGSYRYADNQIYYWCLRCRHSVWSYPGCRPRSRRL